MKRTSVLKKLPLLLLLTLGATVGTAASAAQQPGYTITDLGPVSAPTLAGPVWWGVWTLAINAAGDVVGASPSDAGNVHAALFHNGQVIDLGTLGGLNSEASGINKSGLIVGNSQIASGYVHAFLYSNNVMTDLGTLGGANSYATGINDTGQVVGNSQMSDGTTHAFLYAAGVMTDLGPGAASSINTAGQIVINSSGSASLYTNGAIQPLPQVPCPYYEFQSDAVYAINDSGEVVGDTVYWNGGQFTCDEAISITQDGQATAIGLGLPMGFNAALAINASGHILGRGWTYCDGSVCDQEYTFLDGAALFLAYPPIDSGWSWLNGSALNDAGQIAGVGNNPNSSGLRAFLMTPLPTVSITSPASSALIAGIIPVYASATDATAVAGVQFKLDGANLGAEVIAAPYVTLWNTTLSASGTHVLSAVARDTVGNIGTATPVYVTVLNDTTPPSISITAPASGSSVAGTVTVAAKRDR